MHVHGTCVRVRVCRMCMARVCAPNACAWHLCARARVHVRVHVRVRARVHVHVHVHLRRAAMHHRVRHAMQAPCLVYPLMEGGSLEDRLLLGTVFDEPNGAGAYSTCTTAYALQMHRTACTPSGCIYTADTLHMHIHCIYTAYGRRLRGRAGGASRHARLR